MNTITYIFIFFSQIQFQFINCQTYTSFGSRNDSGLFPNVFNLASGAIITVNATCGETGPEVYCKPNEHVFERSDSTTAQCNVCDAASPDLSKRHPIANAIDGTDAWWQSPTLQNGRKFEWVTITINLKQVYQISHVVVKSAISPLPGNWILERSVDGQTYRPWQYFALSDTECWDTYRVRPTIGKIRYRSDDEVICTSFYSKADITENSEIHISLISGRPGADGPSDALREFTKAQFIRLRLQKIKTSQYDLLSSNSIDPDKLDKSVSRRYFYSIKDITIGGQCLCNGHARDCRVPRYGSGLPQCVCEHNTAGNNCEKCSPLFNQQPYRPASSGQVSVCEECQCFGHSDECYYDQNIADKKLSLNKSGVYEGGGVCSRCRHHTTGINCEQCEDGYYRPEGVKLDSPNPCSKCQCSGPGVSNLCVKDVFHLIEGRKPGDCLCREGFEGLRCERCAKGYKNYPRCDECYCNYAGILNTEVCDGVCKCKENVIGSQCNKCASGHYNLDHDNPEGCALCYCFGATNKCGESDWGLEKISNVGDWMVTDLSGRVKVAPSHENGHLVIANDEIPASIQNVYYWEAPEDYLGQNLYSYGNDLKFIISYVVSRGDVSGYFTDDADIILEGGFDHIRIGYQWHKPSELDEVNTTIIMPLREQNWFKVGSDGKKTDEEVSREEFTLLLYNMKRLLIRAKFHTDQIEGGLYQVDMEKASNTSRTIKKALGTEKCDCPPGYAGLSCQYCAPGYRRVNNILVNGVCEKCNCNNHAESCDPYTGQCSECLHNTTGPNCGECKPGFYGNAREGFEDDCKPCACPLPIASNNFSPTCRLEPNSKYGYICLECPVGYTGDRCERCADGYFGNPMVPGGVCLPCDCGPNTNRSIADFCDHITGQCKCIENTGGWKCEECLPRHWGNAALRDCKPCNCNPEGSESLECNPITGQCQCKPNFTGLRCDRCAPGYGNLEQNCVACNCDLIGSTSPNCDEATGQCPCRPGVFGLHCGECMDGYFGFSEKGCQACKCDPNGSEGPECNPLTGQCKCKPFVIGRDCSHCEPGYWNLASGNGCEPCNCNFTGSVSQVCDEIYGQCDCKPGVGGKHCDRCLPGYYGFSAFGCSQCDPCTAPGHICDPKTGRCVCPPNTAGPTCQDCAPGTWGFDVLTGCSPCDCNLQGSVNNECDHKTGDCLCLEGFEGRHCDKCQFGYYRFPNCRRCDCHEPGTEPDQCRADGRCQCDETGQCPCKANVEGRRCDRCKEGSFALSSENLLGCFECFCFGKASKCEQSSMVWNTLVLPQREVAFEIGNTDIKTVHTFKLIPEQGETVGVRYVVDQPFYWSLPKEALNDQVLSYNGFIRFRLYSRGGSRFPENMLKKFPLIILQGNHRLVLAHSGPAYDHQPSVTGLHQIRLHESEWYQLGNPDFPVTRAILMVALQKVQYILIRASEGADVKLVRITDISMDTAKAVAPAINTAIGVEQCRCPPQYTETSCQDPNIGYYRKRKPNYLDSKDILDLVGWAEPCPCNNMSRTCDKETGICTDCTGFTTGPYCNLCLKGYYGDPTRGIPCRPCACPTVENSFSDTCELRGTKDWICTNCTEGYTGVHCELCADGYWGNPMGPRGVCMPCNCSPFGSLDNICDKVTGQCRCKEGISGLKCDNCPPRHIITDSGCLNCDDDCTGLLLDDVEFLRVLVQEANLTDVGNLPWTRLLHLTNRFTTLINQMTDYHYIISQGHQILGNYTVSFDLETWADILYLKSRELNQRGPILAKEANDVKNDAQAVLDMLNDLWEIIIKIVNQLRRYGIDAADPIGHSSDRMLQEAERILRELQARDFRPRTEEADRELRKAKNLLERVLQLLTDRHSFGPLKDRLDRLQELLRDILSIVQNKVQPPTQTAARLVEESHPIARFVNEAIQNSTVHADVANRTLIEARELLEAAKNALIEAAVTYDILPRLLEEVDNGTRQVEERRSILARLNPEYSEKYVIPCQKHADDLMRQVLFLTALFNETRDVAEYPLQAAKVYQKIIDALAAAEKAAREANEAAERAYKTAYPGTDDALTLKAQRAKKRSEELLQQAKDIRDIKIPELDRELAKKRYRLDVIADDLANGKRNLDLINRALDALPKDLSGILRGVEAKLRIILDGLDSIHRRIDDIDKRIQQELMPKLDRLRAGTTSGLDNLTKIIEQARSDIRDGSRLAEKAEEIADRVNRLHNQMELNLKDLKDRILLARQKSASIRVSLGTDRDGVCARTYEPQIEPSISNNIIMNYAIKDEARDSLLFFIGSRRNDDFMAIEMVDRKIRFIWNAGGGTKMLAHSLNIETNDQQLLKDSQWYKIEVNRIGNMAILTVKRTPDGTKADPFEISDTSPQGFNRMDLNQDSYFFIGEFPPDFRAPREIRSNSFAGCLYELTLDGKPVGLWNFTSNKGCEGCKEGATEHKELSTFQFKGEDSYAILSQIKRYDKKKYLISLQFRSFDEEALLFFTANSITGDYMAIFLKNGNVVFEFRAGNSGRVTLTTRNKYNTGQWVRLDAGREKLEGVLQVQDEEIPGSLSPGNPTTMELADSELYFGGVTTNFTTHFWPTVVFKPFLGGIKDAQIDTTPLNLLQEEAFGVETGYVEKPIKVVSFKGSGYLQLNSVSLKEEADFSFTFKTTQSDALLLLSTWEGTRGSRAKDSHYYSLSIVNGILEARFNGGVGETILNTEVIAVNDGSYHTVSVSKKIRKILLSLDDKEIGTTRLARGTKDIDAPTQGGLFLGGLPQGMSLKGMAGTKEPLKGVIRDAVFNGKLLRLNEPVSFEGVGIGRESDVSNSFIEFDFDDRMESMPSQVFETCAPMARFRVEERAVKVGDTSHSYISLNRDQKVFAQDFKITLEFRTYYPNGLIFLVKGQNKKSKFHLKLHLKAGKLLAELAEKAADKRIRLITTNIEALNDGQWHNLTLEKRNKTISLAVDRTVSVESSKVRKKLPLRSPIYIGGVPERLNEINDLNEFDILSENFKGCLKNLYINEHYVNLVSGQMNNVNECFARIEKGAYFVGNGFAVFDEKFNLGFKVDIELELRTTRMNGIVLAHNSRSDKQEVPALAIELFNGDVIASIDIGDGPIRAVKRFVSRFTICDDNWHLIKVLFTKSSISLKVDKHEVVYGLNENNDYKKSEPFSSAPLYIGGLPEFATNGVLQQRDHFVGCLRNIAINDMRKDWISDIKLFNVLPNACPIE